MLNAFLKTKVIIKDLCTFYPKWIFVIWHVDVQSKHFLKEKKSMTLQNMMKKTIIICPYPNPSPFIKKKHIVFLAYTSLTVHLNFADVTLSERRVTLWVGYTGQSLIVVYDILSMWRASNVKARRYGIDCKIAVLETQSSL